MKWIFSSRIALSCLTGLMLSSATLVTQVNAAGFETKQKQWVGQTAPQFKLQDQDGQWHQLQQYKGQWVVLYFYPKDNSPGCTQEAQQFNTLNADFKKNNTVVLGVSLDDVQSHAQFSKKLGLKFPILADQQHQLANQLGVVRNLGPVKFAKRESFLIDPNSNIVYHYTSVDSQSHATQVLKDIQQLKQK